MYTVAYLTGRGCMFDRLEREAAEEQALLDTAMAADSNRSILSHPIHTPYPPPIRTNSRHKPSSN